MKQAAIILGIALVAFSSCKKKPDPVTGGGSNTGNTSTDLTAFRFTFSNVVDGQPLALKTGNYINAHGDSFTVSMYRYYVSNFSFVKEDGTSFADTGYYLVDEADNASKKFTISNVPAGKYVKLRFLIGVDSARNTAGAQSGNLDPLAGMHWDWSSGYVMAKMEGTSPQSNNNKELSFHIAGYKGITSVLRWVTLTLPKPITAVKDATPNVLLVSDVAEWFKNPQQIDFAQLPTVMTEGGAASEIADNYADMFTIDHVE